MSASEMTKFVDAVAIAEAKMSPPFWCEAHPDWARELYDQMKQEHEDREAEWQELAKEFGFDLGPRREFPNLLPLIVDQAHFIELFGVPIRINAQLAPGTFRIQR